MFKGLSFRKLPAYKNLFLRKKSSWLRAALDLAWVEKGEVIQDITAPTLSTNSGTEQQTGKNLSQQRGVVIRFLNGTSQEIKVKLNESRLLKFYQVKRLKENSTENSAEKNFKEESQLNELWNVSTKQNKKKKKKKRKEKYSNSKNFVS